ncbi:hypothetical protein NUSPORA_01756 [Nucleospora cyclopteri]
MSINENSNLIEIYYFQQTYDSYFQMRRDLDFFITQNNIDINTNIGFKHALNFFFIICLTAIFKIV